MRILLVEDHSDIAGVIFDYFELHGHQLDYARDGEQGFQLAMNERFDAIVLDRMLPRMDGMTVCKNLREAGIDTPILMLTARDQNQDIIDGFEQGADDYLVKPFDLGVLEARLTALDRRRKDGSAKRKLVFGELSLDLTTRILERKSCRFQLNQSLFRILKLLMTRAPDVVSREDLISELWGEEEPDSDVLRAHIYQLRHKIDKPFNHAYINTVPKLGYQLVLEKHEESRDA